MIVFFFFFSSRRRHTRCLSDWSSDVCSSDLNIDRFTTLAHNMKVTSLDLLATAAVRDSSDGPEFMAALASRPGIKSHIVSGQDEARFSGFGVMCGMPDASGVMGDLGGGSLELVALGNGGIGSSSTL